MNYQKGADIILGEYYRSQGLTFEVPDPLGGDHKNDGWVVESGTFFQVYSPREVKSSFASETRKKFDDDFGGLCDLVLSKGQWGGAINKFYMIVNTRDGSLPPDYDRHYESAKKAELEAHQGKAIGDVKVVNDNFLKDILLECGDSALEATLTKLDLYGCLAAEKISSADIVRFVGRVSAKISDGFLQGPAPAPDFTRVPPDKKLDINKLGGYQARFDQIYPYIGAVDKANEECNEDIASASGFQRTKDFVIASYRKNSAAMSGIDLYQKVRDDLTGLYPTGKTAAEMVVAYVFDKCDIFKKE